jgi:perosamine synthetase
MSAQSPHADLARQIADAIESVVGGGPVMLHEPRFGGHEWAYVKECLDSTFVSSVGKFVDRFEADLAAFTGARHAVAVVNGTAALQVALRLVGVQPNDEVLMPALSFVATAAAARHAGAVPHFVDSEAQTLGVDPAALRDYLTTMTSQMGGVCVNRLTGRPIRALVPMHTFGHPVDIEGLLSVAHDFRLALVEDAAESLGSTVNGRHTGTFGVAGTLSFNGNKTVTTGGGGAILTNDADLAARAKHLTTTAKVPHRWAFVHDDIGYNYRMPNLNAALGCAQLEQLPTMIDAKRQLFTRYAEAFARLSYVDLVEEPDRCRSNYWLQTLRLAPEVAAGRDAVLEATNDRGLMTRPVWTLMHHLAPYAACPRMPLPCAESLEQRLINIPSSAFLADAGPHGSGDDGLMTN